MDWYEPEVRELIQSLTQKKLPDRPAAFYGSSSIRMWDDLATDLKDERAVNLGFGGSTLEACVYFFQRLVPPVNPSSLVVYAGDNDLGDGRSPEDVLHSFRGLAALVTKWLPEVPFGFISVKPSPSRVALLPSIKRTNALVQRELDQYPGAYYINVFDAMLDGRGRPRPELFLDDGLHLSRAGYKLWSNQLEPFRNRIFTPVSSEIPANGLPSALGES